MSKATYHTNYPPFEQEYTVKKTHADGTVDLVNDEGTIIIEKCPVTDTATIGSCVIEGSSPKEEESGDGLETFTKAELVAQAESLSIATAGLNKGDLIEAIRAADNEP